MSTPTRFYISILTFIMKLLWIKLISNPFTFKSCWSQIRLLSILFDFKSICCQIHWLSNPFAFKFIWFQIPFLSNLFAFESIWFQSPLRLNHLIPKIFDLKSICLQIHFLSINVDCKYLFEVKIMYIFAFHSISNRSHVIRFYHANQQSIKPTISGVICQQGDLIQTSTT